MQLKSLLLGFVFFIFTISAVPDSPICEVEDKPLGPFPDPPKGYYEEIVEKLKYIIGNNTWEVNFETAITNAHETNATEMVNIKNLTDYYNFLNYLVLWMPSEDETGTFVYRMICTMYFVLDQKTVKPFQSPIVPWSPPQLTELSQWIVDFVDEMGKFLDTPESLNVTTLQTFYTALNYNVDAYEVPNGGWKTFNEFFARKFLNGTRPIDGPSNPAVIVSLQIRPPMAVGISMMIQLSF